MTAIQTAMYRMKRCIEVPTGHIVISKGEKGKGLEFVSLGDYGKAKNIKASFLGLDEEINGVPHGDLLPLEEKWVITVSTQYGCSMGCKFCDVPKVGPGINVTYHDLINQIKDALSLHSDKSKVEYTKRLNIHFARMGEPTFNGNVLDAAMCLRRNIFDFSQKSKIHKGVIHPVISTMMPKNNKYLSRFLDIWCNDIKNKLYKGDAGLQFSINSTDNSQRDEMFNGNSLSLEEIAHEGEYLPMPVGRKYALNFALADNYEIDPDRLRWLFHPDKFMVKITPLHDTKACSDNSIQTTDGYSTFAPYKETEDKLKAVGFDVLVFIPSKEEDLGRITCGNAILSGSEPDCKHQDLFTITKKSIWETDMMNI